MDFDFTTSNGKVVLKLNDANNQTINEQLGYLDDNVLIAGQLDSDTAAIATDLRTGALAVSHLLANSFISVNVTYETTIS